MYVNDRFLYVNDKNDIYECRLTAIFSPVGQLHILPKYSYRKTYRKIFYLKKLRKRLLKRAANHCWLVVRQNGSSTRKWERD
ncbi:hypothetical protein A4D02_14765 [Niastella koreensis]|uniref:Uncharacterized protein n=1 Tax=Niastella koreensis TaxID=354356 RepID=A0ABX3NNR7_9BACT|nr:hypothetical protein A4D02_14765 [Niastella koreensis]